jgi:hypothetical protein
VRRPGVFAIALLVLLEKPFSEPRTTKITPTFAVLIEGSPVLPSSGGEVSRSTACILSDKRGYSHG